MYDKATSRQLSFLRYNGCAFASGEYAAYLTKKEASALIGLYTCLNAIERSYVYAAPSNATESIVAKIKGIQHNAMQRKYILFS